MSYVRPLFPFHPSWPCKDILNRPGPGSDSPSISILLIFLSLGGATSLQTFLLSHKIFHILGTSVHNVKYISLCNRLYPQTIVLWRFFFFYLTAAAYLGTKFRETLRWELLCLVSKLLVGVSRETHISEKETIEKTISPMTPYVRYNVPPINITKEDGNVPP